MDPLAGLGSLVSAGVNAWQGAENRAAQKEYNDQQLNWSINQSIVQQQQARENLAQQREFAQQGIRWKVTDAAAAGLHPLAALGAQVSSYSPVSIGGTDLDTKPATMDLGNMGQDLSRAIAATSTQEEKLSDYQTKLQALQLERGSLENTLLKAQILKSTQPSARQPSFPSANMGTDGQPAIAAETSAGFPVTADKIEQKADTIPKYARMRPLGIPLLTNPASSDAEDVENRYGDMAEKWVGIGNFPLDAYYTVQQHGKDRGYFGGRTFKERWNFNTKQVPNTLFRKRSPTP